MVNIEKFMRKYNFEYFEASRKKLKSRKKFACFDIENITILTHKLILKYAKVLYYKI